MRKSVIHYAVLTQIDMAGFDSNRYGWRNAIIAAIESKTECSMNRQEIQAKIDSINWYHDFDFPNGFRARANLIDSQWHRRSWEFVRRSLAQFDFRNKRVLDIGCWDGYWSFYAEQKGARSVLATDDLSQNWSAGEGLFLAKELLDSSIEINQNLNVYDVRALENKTFDVILCLGVYYHLHSPFYAFSQIRHCCSENTIVIFEGDVGQNFGAFEVQTDFANGRQSTFNPSLQVFETLVKAAYFEPIERHFKSEHVFDSPTSDLSNSDSKSSLDRWWDPMKLGEKWKQSKARKVIKKTKARLRPKRFTDRAVYICRPFCRANDEVFYYRPPFGLDAYDPRFQKPRAAA
jgi:tRNA (mo5U34)-methyltransferase